MDLIQFLEVDVLPEEVNSEVPTILEVERDIERYLKIADREKAMKKEKGTLKNRIIAFLEEHATADQKGSLKMEMTAGKIEQIVREKATLDEDKAIAFCQALDWDDCVVERPVLVEPMFEQRIKNGEVDHAQLVEMVDIKANRALYVKKK